MKHNTEDDHESDQFTRMGKSFLLVALAFLAAGAIKGIRDMLNATTGTLTKKIQHESAKRSTDRLEQITKPSVSGVRTISLPESVQSESDTAANGRSESGRTSGS